MTGGKGDDKELALGEGVEGKKRGRRSREGWEDGGSGRGGQRHVAGGRVGEGERVERGRCVGPRGGRVIVEGAESVSRGGGVEGGTGVRGVSGGTGRGSGRG
ncbi:hypothetical protein A6V37_37820 [Paraburkholderia ginsengiterrae]|uniref:Uncharacterized protein n=1 Tax=Paraburkholderia ginsengiterrae TaxID=1462993 RepID=A0A1A9NDX3_9BURK|nr:hypothetical protein A6V37_37820 [Paraburkholderia ginsengiterrae]